MNNQVNHDLKTLVNWLKANNICLDVEYFTQQTTCGTDLKNQTKWKKKLYESDSVKYFEMQINQSLTWKQQFNNVAVTINKASAVSLN